MHRSLPRSRTASPARSFFVVLLIAVVATLVAIADRAGAGAPIEQMGTWMPVWTAVLQSSPGGESDFECAVAMPKGSYVVGGEAPQSEASPHAAVIARYGRKGGVVWRRYWNPDVSSAIMFRWIGRDRDFNLYAACPVPGPQTGMDGTALVKYSPGGKRKWVRTQILGPAISFDMRCLAVDGRGNTYVAGFGGGEESEGPDWIVGKLSPAGRVLWTAAEDRVWRHSPADIAVDASGVYVTGTMSVSADGSDGPLEACTTMKYTTSGKRRWTMDYYCLLYTSDAADE